MPCHDAPSWRYTRAPASRKLALLAALSAVLVCAGGLLPAAASAGTGPGVGTVGVAPADCPTSAPAGYATCLADVATAGTPDVSGTPDNPGTASPSAEPSSTDSSSTQGTAKPADGEHSADLRPSAPAATPLQPADLQAAYQVPTSTTTATVAVVDAYDSPSAEADMAAYRGAFDLAPCTSASGCLTTVNQAGASSPLPAVDDAWAGEISLDLDMVSAICQSCHILLVEANSAAVTDLAAAVATATRLGASYVSMSFAAAEWPTEAAYSQQYLGQSGVVYAAATGDDGIGAAWPAALPNVIAVGGTSLVRDATTARGWRETAWNLAGSGCSAYIPAPAYQSSVGIGGNCARRAVADISAVADPATGVYAVVGGKWYQYGGTSAGAPIIAALAAVSGTHPAPASLYENAAADPTVVNDITSGASAGCGLAGQTGILCAARAGWDGPSGVGSPNGTAVLAGLRLNNPGPVQDYAGRAVDWDTSAQAGPHGTVSYTATGLPPGLAVNQDTGHITGTLGVPPGTASSATGTAQVSATAADGTTATASFGWTVLVNTVQVDGSPAQAHLIGEPIAPVSFTASSTTALALTWAATGLPAGLRLDAASGTVTGVPTALGTSTATISASDQFGGTGQLAVTWSVARTVITVSGASNRTSLQGAVASGKITGTDSDATLTGALSYTASSLPPGVRLASNGVFSGAPSKVGTFAVSVIAKDTTGSTGTARFTWAVRAHTLVVASKAAIAGKAKAGKTVTLKTATLRADSKRGMVVKVKHSIAWLLDGKKIKGAKSDTLKLKKAWRGHTIKATVKGSAAGFTAVTYSSAARKIG